MGNPIDLSAGLVPKQNTGIDLSAGLVEKNQESPGFLSALGEDLLGVAKSLPQVLGGPIAAPYFGLKKAIEDYKVYKETGKTPAQLEDESRKQAGYGLGTRALAPVAEAIGVNVQGMERAAARGDTAGVFGHTVVPTAMAAAPLAAEGIGKVSGRIAAPLTKASERVYQSTLKPPPGSFTTPEVKVMVKTGLQEGIPVSPEGAQKLLGLVSQLNDAVSEEIANRPGARISPQAVAQRIEGVKSKFVNQVNASEDVAAIESSRQQFLREQGQRPGRPAIPPAPTGILDQYGNPIMGPETPATAPRPASPMSAEKAQALKVGTYKQLSGKYGELSSATVEAQKALARGIKEELETQFPEIHDLNAREGRLIGLDEALERAVRRTQNRNPLSLGGTIAVTGATAATGALTGSVGEAGAAMAASAILHHIVTDPVVQSKLAITLNHAARAAGRDLPIGIARSKVAQYVTALGALQASQEEGQ